MPYLLLAILFYFQNFIASLFLSFIFIPNIFEFLSILILIIIFSKLKYSKLLLYSWQLLYLIQFSFIAYFGTTITYIDIYLFFTHIEETLETFLAIYNLVLIPLVMSLILVIIIYKVTLLKSTITYSILLPTLILSIFLNPKLSDASFQLISQLYNTHKLYNHKKPSIIKQKNLIAIQQADINIILVLGESMRAKEYLDEQYSIFNNYNYYTIYSGATNTDVSIPLLINGATRPSHINNKNNLFKLAKQNNFNTSFITTQSPKSLKYINPYLDINSIDNYKVLRTDDIQLLDELNYINFKQNNLLVMQMNGQHSPYLHYPNSSRDTNIATRYKQSLSYSNKILEQLIKTIKSKSNKPYIFIFTSDHGEHIGENKKYGHNKFDEEIYKVPYIYTTNLDTKLNTIKSHNDIYQNILLHLGFTNQLHYNRPIKVYGTMITEEDGYITIK